MARLVFGMNVSLDGYVDHQEMQIGPDLFRHWTEQVAGLAGSVYGRRVYELMRYWDAEDPAWTPAQRAFAAAWRRQPKWVASRGALAVGPNATRIAGDVAAAVGDLKARLDGEIAVAGPTLAQGLAGLIDEYRLYYLPAVLGRGTPFFAGPPPPLRLVASERMDAATVRLAYVPA